MPATASSMPITVPTMPDDSARIRVFGRPVRSRSGNARLYSSQSKNVSPSCCKVDLGCAVDGSAVAAFCSAMAAKSGSCGSGAVLLPGFQPAGSSRGTQSEYSRDQVPSAITASRPEFSASISG